MLTTQSTIYQTSGCTDLLKAPVLVPGWTKQLKPGFEAAGSWLTSSDQLPVRHV